MKNPLGGGNGMVPHYSGTTLDAQARYAAGTKSILQNFFEGKPQEPGNIIVAKGKSNRDHVHRYWYEEIADPNAAICRSIRDQGLSVIFLSTVTTLSLTSLYLQMANVDSLHEPVVKDRTLDDSIRNLISQSSRFCHELLQRTSCCMFLYAFSV